MRFCLCVTVAALAALALVQTFCFPLHGLWTVLTAIVVTQVSIGGSLRATVEYMIGTLGGAIYAAALGVVLIPHTTAALAGSRSRACDRSAGARGGDQSELPRRAVFPRDRAADRGDMGASPIGSAVTRVSEVAFCGLVAVAVSMLVLPERAHRLSLEVAAES